MRCEFHTLSAMLEFFLPDDLFDGIVGYLDLA